MVSRFSQALQVILTCSQAGELWSQSKKVRELPEKSVEIGAFADARLSSRGWAAGFGQLWRSRGLSQSRGQVQPSRDEVWMKQVDPGVVDILQQPR